MYRVTRFWGSAYWGSNFWGSGFWALGLGVVGLEFRVLGAWASGVYLGSYTLTPHLACS